MKQRDLLWFGGILVLVAVTVWMVLNPDYPIQPGLDLQGGLQVLLAADVPEDTVIERDQMDTARQIRPSAAAASRPSSRSATASCTSSGRRPPR
jgi:preprotein translocase subunit SecD